MLDDVSALEALRIAFAHSTNMIFVASGDGSLVLACGAAKGVASGTFVGDVVETQADVRAIVRRVLDARAPESFEASVSSICLQVDASPIDDSCVLLVGTDVTERKKTEERLRRSESMLVDTQGVAHLGTWEWDVSEPTATWSAELYRIYDLTKETYTPSYEAYLTKVHPDDRAHVMAATNRAFHEHIPYSHDERILRPDGSIRYLHTWAYPVLDEAGKLVKLVGVCQDITDRKQAEIAVAEHERRLLEAHKLEAIGRLAGGIAHDFNNLLTVIVARSTYVQRRLPQGSPLHDSLDEINGVVKQAARLIQQLLTFSRGEQSVRERIDMKRVVLDLTDIFGRALGGHVELVTALEDGAFVEGDRSQLDQVVLNLVVNARDAMPSGGKLTVELMGAPRESLPADLDPTASYVMLRVTDTGVGMDEAVRSRIFDPYFTTKETGNGLGLSTTYGIVRRSGGTISVESTPGVGSRFTVHLPRTTAPVQPLAAKEKTERATVLLVEDQEALRHLIRVQLQDLGYHVIDAPGPTDALAIARDTQFDLLLTDLIMPKMNGVELARRIRELHAGTRVLFVSGWADEAMLGNSRDEGPLLGKPFTSNELARAIGSALGRD
jgi:signal transduction histidine kinase/CheY-like chemotaxis protein